MHNKDQHIHPKNNFFHDFALTIILFGLMAVSLALQFYTGWIAFAADQTDHGQAAAIWGDDGYIWEFMVAVFENWQSEFLQLWAFVVLTTYFIHRNSPQSRDNDDENAERIEKIEKIISKLEKQLGK
jgi:hypothetical protein